MHFVISRSGVQIPSLAPSIAGSAGSLELARKIEAKIKSELVAGEYYDRRKRIPTVMKYGKNTLKPITQIR